MNSYWWVAPILALIGALLGGMLATWVGSLLAERRADRALVRGARVALERWYETRIGPMDLAYPGIDPDTMKQVSDDSVKQFFTRHFQETFQAKAAIGAVRALDRCLAEILDLDRWDLPSERIDDLRDALNRAYVRAWRGKHDDAVLMAADE